MSVCECGCGAEVARKFARGHWIRVPGNNLANDSKVVERRRLSLKETLADPERRAKRLASLAEIRRDPEVRENGV